MTSLKILYLHGSKQGLVAKDNDSQPGAQLILVFLCDLYKKKYLNPPIDPFNYRYTILSV